MRSDHGAAAVVLLAAAFVLALVGAATGAVAQYLIARTQAALAADAAALAAAPVTFRPYGSSDGPAAEAARFSAANGARLVRCACRIDRTWRTRVVTVEVERSVSLLLLGTVNVRETGSAEFSPIATLR